MSVTASPVIYAFCGEFKCWLYHYLSLLPFPFAYVWWEEWQGWETSGWFPGWKSESFSLPLLPLCLVISLGPGPTSAVHKAVTEVLNSSAACTGSACLIPPFLHPLWLLRDRTVQWTFLSPPPWIINPASQLRTELFSHHLSLTVISWRAGFCFYLSSFYFDIERNC